MNQMLQMFKNVPTDFQILRRICGWEMDSKSMPCWYLATRFNQMVVL